MNKPTTSEQLFAEHQRLSAKALELMRRKNADYAGTAVEQDALKNFRLSGMVVGDVASGILVRLCDKFARLGTFVFRGTLAVSDESIEDTILDSINYLVILRAALAERKTEAKRPEPEAKRPEPEEDDPPPRPKWSCAEPGTQEHTLWNCERIWGKIIPSYEDGVWRAIAYAGDTGSQIGHTEDDTEEHAKKWVERRLVRAGKAWWL